MTDTVSTVGQVQQFAIASLVAAEPLPYHNIETLNRTLESLELLVFEEKLTDEEADAASLALQFYFTGFPNLVAEDVKEYFYKAKHCSLSNFKKWCAEQRYPAQKAAAAKKVLENLMANEPNFPAGKAAIDALYADWAREKGKKHLKALLEQLVEKAGLDKANAEQEGLHLLYNHHYFTSYAKRALEAGKIEVIEKLEKDLKDADHQTDIVLKNELHVDGDQLKQLKKKLKSLKERDDKSFMDMLRSTSRNHYTLNQMVDRKARIIVWVNAFVLSLITNKMLEQPDLNDWRLYLLLLPSISGICSIFYAVLSVRPEKSHGKLSVDDIHQCKGNPLFFGNFQALPLDEYENSMLGMVNNKEFVYRAMIQDIYFLGQALQQKRRYLYTSLYIFLAGITLTLIAAYVLRLSQST